MAAANANASAANEPRTLIERTMLGLDLSSGAAALADGAFLQLENLIPYANGHLAVFPGPLLVEAAPAGETIYALWAFVYQNEPYLFIQCTDGSVWVRHTDSAGWTELATAGATTVNGLHMTKWQATDAEGNVEAILWVDTAKGYGALQGISAADWVTLQAAQTGQAIAVYAGRVWIAADTEVVFTAPDTYNDFTAADYAGSFKVTDPTMSGPIIGLYSSQNWLYIAGSGMLALNNVQVQILPGATAAVTTFYTTPVSASIGITNERAGIVLDNVLFLETDVGVFAYYGLNGRNLAKNIGDNFFGSGWIAANQVFGRNLLHFSTGYCFMVEDQRWFTTIADAKTWVSAGTLIWQGTTTYVATASAVYRVGSDDATVRTCTLATKLYDAGNAVMNKRVTKAGFETFQDELIAPRPSPLPLTFNAQVVGYQAPPAGFSEANVDGTKNQWLRRTVSLTDRYFGLEATLTVGPSLAIGGFFWEFIPSTSWP